MENQVPFKVFTFWRWGSQPEVRRFGVDRNVVSSYTYLLAKIHDVFPKLKEKTFNLSWKDEEGDYVKITSDDDVMTMLTAVPDQLFKLHVHVDTKNCGVDTPHVGVVNVAFAPAPLEPSQMMHAGPPGLHRGVICDSCNRSVIGFRYKCVSCEDFDLCSSCEALRAHPNHCVVRIPNPQMSLQVVKDSIKKSRSFLKTFAATLNDAQKNQKAEMKKAQCGSSPTTSGCPMSPHWSSKLEAKMAAKERREERREERHEKRQEKHEKRHERREEERRERRENPHDRVGWMEVFSKYVDQFANLAADHIRGATTDGEQTSQSADESPNPYLDPAEFARMMNACMNMRDTGCPLAEMFGQDGPQGTPQDSPRASTDQPAATPSTSQAEATQAPTAPPVAPQAPVTPQVATQAPATPQVATPAPATPQVAAQAPTTPQVPTASVPPQAAQETKADKSDASSVSSAEVTSRDISPDKSAEDWTMINAEKDIDADTGAANPALMDSKLPEEFQPRPGAAFGFIYPPLNAATAVCNPKEPVVVPAKTEAPAPTQAQPQPQFTQGYNGATGFTQAQPGSTLFGQGFVGQAGNGLFGRPGFGSSTQGQATGQGFFPAQTFGGSGDRATFGGSGDRATFGGSPGQAAFTGFPQPTFGVPPSQAKPSQPEAPADAPKPTAPASEQRQHRVPHIDAAIRQMLAMGFTNEGGWLTQLLESKDGNIAAVLDLLTPVKPSK